LKRLTLTLWFLDSLSFVVSANNSQFVASDDHGLIKIFDINTRQVIHQFESPEKDSNI